MPRGQYERKPRAPKVEAPVLMERCMTCPIAGTAAEKALVASLIRGGLELDAAVAALKQARAVYGADGR